MTLPEMNYEAIKREIMPILHHNVLDNDHNELNGAVSQRHFLSEEKR